MRQHSRTLVSCSPPPISDSDDENSSSSSSLNSEFDLSFQQEQQGRPKWRRRRGEERQERIQSQIQIQSERRDRTQLRIGRSGGAENDHDECWDDGGGGDGPDGGGGGVGGDQASLLACQRRTKPGMSTGTSGTEDGSGNGSPGQRRRDGRAGVGVGMVRRSDLVSPTASIRTSASEDSDCDDDAQLDSDRRLKKEGQPRRPRSSRPSRFSSSGDEEKSSWIGKDDDDDDDDVEKQRRGTGQDHVQRVDTSSRSNSSSSLITPTTTTSTKTETKSKPKRKRPPHFVRKREISWSIWCRKCHDPVPLILVLVNGFETTSVDFIGRLIRGLMFPACSYHSLHRRRCRGHRHFRRQAQPSFFFSFNLKSRIGLGPQRHIAEGGNGSIGIIQSGTDERKDERGHREPCLAHAQLGERCSLAQIQICPAPKWHGQLLRLQGRAKGTSW